MSILFDPVPFLSALALKPVSIGEEALKNREAAIEDAMRNIKSVCLQHINLKLSDASLRFVPEKKSDRTVRESPIKLNDPAYLDHRIKLATKKADSDISQQVGTQPLVIGLPTSRADQPSADLCADGMKIGAAAARKPGPQLVFLGSRHDTTDQAVVCAGVVKGAVEAGYQGQIIVAFEESPRDPFTRNLYNYLNCLDYKERLAYSMDPANHLVPNAIQQYKDKAQEDAQLGVIAWDLVPQLDLVNQVLYTAPSALFKNIDTNHQALFTKKGEVTSAEQQKEFAPRDDAMAIQLLALQKKYPSSLIICTVGALHGVEEMGAGEMVEFKPNKALINIEDPLAEQMATINGKDWVHTYYLAPHDSGKLKNTKLDELGGDNGYFDGVITINVVEPTVGWVKPSNWFNPPPYDPSAHPKLAGKSTRYSPD